mmetsp:Transcript_27114/g.65477  ORF Transcript_27114/g.65477 Transcript_27114/m.65477 type:complete len:331 (+) Transcript_27114:126-1118(+)
MGALIPSTLWALALLHAPLTSPRAATAHRPLAPPRRTADAPTAPSARPETSRVDVAEASPVISDGRGHAEADGVKERSALVLGWFYATPRELEYVRKLYTRNGYTHVVVLPSVVQRIAKPRGWYRTIRQHTPPAHLGRHFDVVHCLSGGFLSMYVLRSSGVPITYSSLVLDSTPILPKPGSYTRFTRAYMRENGLAFPLKLLPTRAHEQLVEQRWKLGLRYIKLRHALLRKMGREEEERVASWTSGPAAWALNGDYGRVARHALSTLYQGAVDGARVLFVYNPDDPYIDCIDVDDAAQVPPTPKPKPSQTAATPPSASIYAKRIKRSTSP